MTTIIAALCAALAVWTWTGPNPATTRLSRLTSPHTTTPWPRLPLRARRSSRTQAWQTASIELCQSLSAELAAGRTPGEALARAISTVDFPDPDALRPLIAAARDGGDVPAALTAVAPAQGGEGLRRLAACWEVSVTVGAGLSGLVDRVGSTLRAAQAHRQDVSAQLAGPRTTARMLAALPALGLLMAGSLGMHPLDFLFGSLPGLACLTAGIALDACGLWWTHHLATKAEQSPS
ncbi:type II secretion system F family protein [Nonomuraea sp. NPDC050556]|uniref:type II secretion system F family protein n=1 Tax=Nonomuraea sp. NPDC050556 TaxID=3364369 RepID=UPI0037B8CD27